ncbi:MAG: hypothetical protein U5L73_00065 [Rhodoferax sp.]|nr:hypothetical protein [Rhodoferax sp.]
MSVEIKPASADVIAIFTRHIVFAGFGLPALFDPLAQIPNSAAFASCECPE